MTELASIGKEMGAIMNKYNEVEIQTAKNLLKEGYKWLAREEYGKVYAYTDKPRKKYDWDRGAGTWWNDAHPDPHLFICMENVPIFQSVAFDDEEPTSLESIAHPQILDDTERRYLSAVIRPFRDKVDFICKVNCLDGFGFQRITIGLNDISEDIALPLFKSGTMYKGMETGHGYTLDELGL